MKFSTIHRLGKRSLIGLLGLALVASACGASDATDKDVGLSIVVTTSVLGDLVSQVVANVPDVEVLILMTPGQDPHSFAPSAADAARMQAADLIVINGLGLEEGLLDIVDAAEDEGAAVFEVATTVEPLTRAKPHDGPQNKDGGEPGSLDPHVWLDPVRMSEAVSILGRILGALDPDRAAMWADRAQNVEGELLSLHEELLAIIDELPLEKRVLISNHEALGAFADRYGFEVVATVIPAATTTADPSARDIKNLVAQIEEHGVSAVFAETTARSDVLQVVVDGLGRNVDIVELYTGALGPPGSGADTYRSMMLANASLIIEGLSR